MIIAVIINEQTGQAQFSIEPPNLPVARQVLGNVCNDLDKIIPPEQQPRPKSGLIIPPTAIPRDVGKKLD